MYIISNMLVIGFIVYELFFVVEMGNSFILRIYKFPLCF